MVYKRKLECNHNVTGEKTWKLRVPKHLFHRFGVEKYHNIRASFRYNKAIIICVNRRVISSEFCRSSFVTNESSC